MTLQTAAPPAAEESSIFTGLSAFPITPMRDDHVDLPSYVGIVDMLRESGVDTIAALGSTGSYAYLDRSERQHVLAAAVSAAGAVPVIAGISAHRTAHAIEYAMDAVDAGAAAVLLAPLSYQPLTADDAYGLYADVLERLSVPLIVYDNPSTTRFTFTDELYGRIAQHPGVASIKIPGLPSSTQPHERIRQIRDAIPEDVAIGISGDAFAADALCAGADVWYSVIGGTLPGPALRIARAALDGRRDEAARESSRLQAIWDLYTELGGSLRVVAAMAEALGMAARSSLPRPLRGLDDAQRQRVHQVLAKIALTEPHPLEWRRRPAW